MARAASDNTGEMVKLLPGFATTNVMIPSADIVPLQIQPGPVQTANLIEVQNTSGAAQWAVSAAGVAIPAAGVQVSSGTAPTKWHTGGVGASTTTSGTSTTPVATETYICEVFIPVNCTLTGIAILNAATVGTDKYVVALASSAGVPLAWSALAGTTTAGAASYQRVPFTATYAAVGPAKYHVLLQVNGTTDRFRTHPVGTFGASKKTGEVFGTLTTVTPPTTFTADLGPIACTY